VALEKEFTTDFIPFSPLLEEKTGQLLILPYWENYQKKNLPGFIFDTKSKELKEFGSLPTTYGATFSMDGASLYLASHETGELRVYQNKNMREFFRFSIPK